MRPAFEFRQKVTCALLDCRSDEQQLKVALKLLHESEDIIDGWEDEKKRLKEEIEVYLGTVCSRCQHLVTVPKP